MFYEMENLTNPQTRQAKYVCRNILARSRIVVVVESINYEKLCERVCILVLVTQTQVAPFLHRIIFIPVACLDVPYFSTFSHKGHDFRGGKKLT